ncbi:tRNA (uridine(34)/cytosine(34)/5-carboxymethylaminomethyluridine(34)-2'-O)-methyltransferase TrmL [Clostridiaceae bacterium M8S5]|nr:tRNA (uridine(34)/cytosine(34)/5-carboxymethylaminomethyluridine(34)-2'-O)-methyltransferase TrmL [Clostridiaceae bacterium M8S5]
MSLNIVLIEPEIPQNTGNIARTCAITGAVLHLIRPLGFSVDSKHLKRAGLDYWELLDIRYYDSFEELLNQHDKSKFFYATTKASHKHTDVKYTEDSFLVFGKETKGIPEDILNSNKDQCIRIPMKDCEAARSLNLANSVSIIVYEALRQTDYQGLR